MNTKRNKKKRKEIVLKMYFCLSRLNVCKMDVYTTDFMLCLSTVRYDEEHARFEQQLKDYQKNEEDIGCISCYRQEKDRQVLKDFTCSFHSVNV